LTPSPHHDEIFTV